MRDTIVWRIQAEPTSAVGRLWERCVVRPLGGSRLKTGLKWQDAHGAQSQRFLDRLGVLFEDNKGAGAQGIYGILM